ncbi:MAG: hypothetical protein IT201_03885 [Thermoleophilia bacterium]|nr:hypothetical protein [Thermoleophilia bacterium]
MIVEGCGHPIAARPADDVRDRDAARLGQRLQARGDVDPVAVIVPPGRSITSPRWTPTRKRRRRLSGSPASRVRSSRRSLRAAVIAPAAVSKVASTESPAMSTTRPWLDSIRILKTARAASSSSIVRTSPEAIRRA